MAVDAGTARSRFRTDGAIAQRAFDHQRTDRPGMPIHLGVALLACVAASGPISVLEFVFAFALLAPLSRIVMTWRLWTTMFRQPVFLAALAWAGWTALSILWSPDRDAGWRELGALRWAGWFFILWPMMERRPTLVIAWAVGFVLGHLSQAGHGLALMVGEEHAPAWLLFDRAHDRVTGWFGPVSGGTAMCAILGLHLHQAATRTGRVRLIAGVLGAVTLAGIVATGTRGAWLAAGGVVLIAGVLAASAAAGAGRKRGALAAIGVLLFAIVAGGVLAGPRVASRIADARAEIADASRGEMDTNIGARIVMAQEALRMGASRPIGGVGVGGYRATATERLHEEGVAEPQRLIHSHAHSTPLHVFATTGFVGLALWTLLIVCVFRALLSRLPGERNTYDAGLWLAFAGLLLAGMFETLHVGSRIGAHFWLLLAFATAWRPMPNPLRHGRPGIRIRKPDRSAQ
ncbi:MAG: O-antigen ligase family protein [Phycisphaerales bacterium]|nr:MAG: O-antigen ligase family protein [Phycisphaerales bacterium]